jgi:hypothetical protein
MPAQLTLFGRPMVPSKIEELFNHFSAVFPPRRGSDPRKPALDKFMLLVEKYHIDPQEIIAGARRYADSRPLPEFICQMTTFLNQRRWEQTSYGPASDPNGSMLDISVR